LAVVSTMACSAAPPIGLSVDVPAVEPGREHVAIRRAIPTRTLTSMRPRNLNVLLPIIAVAEYLKVSHACWRPANMLHLCSTECCCVVRRAAGPFVGKKSRRFKFDEVRQRFRLTPTERRVAVFIAAAFLLGLITKCYRDAHPSTPPVQTHSGTTKTSMSRRTSRKGL
jgi:hypothetical protein